MVKPGVFKTRGGGIGVVLPALPPIPEPEQWQDGDTHLDGHNAAKRMREQCAAVLRTAGMTVAFPDEPSVQELLRNDPDYQTFLAEDPEGVGLLRGELGRFGEDQ